jgi:hypothetical protein
VCGDGKCDKDGGETASNCAKDCGLPSPVCGDGKCEGSENSSNCAKDCGAGAVCGNGKCEPGETAAKCPKDCGGGGGGALSCVGKCGKYDEASKCQCDSECEKYMDCCNDLKKVCPDGGGGGGTPAGSGMDCWKKQCTSEVSSCKADTGCGGVWLYLEVSDCAEKAGCKDQTCAQQKCASQLAACQKDTKCQSFSTCLSKCAQGNQQCQAQCMQTTGGAKFTALGTCVQSKCAAGG